MIKPNEHLFLTPRIMEVGSMGFPRTTVSFTSLGHFPLIMVIIMGGYGRKGRVDSRPLVGSLPGFSPA